MAILNQTGMLLGIDRVLREMGPLAKHALHVDFDIAAESPGIATKLDDVRIVLECGAGGVLTADLSMHMQHLFSDTTPILALPPLDTSGWRSLEAS